jgi:hypothetical protein
MDILANEFWARACTKLFGAGFLLDACTLRTRSPHTNTESTHEIRVLANEFWTRACTKLLGAGFLLECAHLRTRFLHANTERYSRNWGSLD